MKFFVEEVKVLDPSTEKERERCVFLDQFLKFPRPSGALDNVLGGYASVSLVP